MAPETALSSRRCLTHNATFQIKYKKTKKTFEFLRVLRRYGVTIEDRYKQQSSDQQKGFLTKC